MFSSLFLIFSHLPTETLEEVLDFCTREELANGVCLVNWQFYAISSKLMFEERKYCLRTHLSIDDLKELPTTKMPKNITGTTGNQLYIKLVSFHCF